VDQAFCNSNGTGAGITRRRFETNNFQTLKMEPKFVRYRSKVGFVAHIALQTRMDINQHAVNCSTAQRSSA
jgi:hypothetical protein